jgi:cell wall-associated NlpC family hydrolase
MANRIILGAVLTLALTFPPGLAQAVPTKGTKKKSATKTQTKVSNKSKSSKEKGRSSTSEEETPIRGEMMSSTPTTGVERASRKSVGVPETPPLMKVTPQRDGRFLLEPLSPKKPGNSALSRPTSQLDPAPPSSPRSYNRFEPWNFSDLVLTQAKYYRDTPYSRGGSLQNGFATDCSGFVQYIYRGFKIDLPRSSAEQAQVGKVAARTMDFSKLLPGDLLFFSRGGRHIGHAGIYLGEGKMIHASNRRLGVTVTDLRQPYYEGTFVVAKRVFEVQYPK